MLNFLLALANIQLHRYDSFLRFILLLSGNINVTPSPITVNNNSIPLNTLPFRNCSEPAMSFECNSSGCYKAHDNSKYKTFKIMGWHILHLNVNNLLPKIKYIRFRAKQSKASIIWISESKLDPSILNSHLDIENYNLIRLGRSRRHRRGCMLY